MNGYGKEAGLDIEPGTNAWSRGRTLVCIDMTFQDAPPAPFSTLKAPVDCLTSMIDEIISL